MTKTCCPKCKSTDQLSAEIKISCELNWNSCDDEYDIGEECDRFSFKSLKDDTEISCGSCGWSGRFDQLKPMTEKYRVVLIMDLNLEDHGPLGDWDWKDKLGLQEFESVTVDGVNKL